ncbi:hypothetical protein [Rubrivivax sp. JA1026]|uniref:hypothetical protein n=1 Tax=Rubrivivax sp. JA1026 TaxID=2710888 RepID=UPI0013E93A7F|nr:hypothetical protein [Rubrivivax sp. JA1026]
MASPAPYPTARHQPRALATAQTGYAADSSQDLRAGLYVAELDDAEALRLLVALQRRPINVNTLRGGNA